MNTVNLLGRTTRDIELRKTTTGKSVCSFSLAVNGFKKEDVDFIPCVAWEKTAETLEKYVPKGTMIGVEGRLQVRKWEDKEGKNRETMEVLVNRIHFTGKSEKNTNTISTNEAPLSVEPDEFAVVDESDDLPF